jgi:hypothetical protein
VSGGPTNGLPAEAPEPRRDPPGFFGTLREVAWAFFGVRDRQHYERTTRANPLHILAAGVLLSAGFVVMLLVIVHFAIKAAAG